MQKDYDSLFELIEYPCLPHRVKPTRDEFDNNAQWGAALDEYESEVKQDKIDLRHARERYDEKVMQFNDEFWIELYSDFGWDSLPQSISDQLKSLLWNQHHAAGHNAIYNAAYDYKSLVDAIIHHLE